MRNIFVSKLGHVVDSGESYREIRARLDGSSLSGGAGCICKSRLC